MLENSTKFSTPKLQIMAALWGSAFGLLFSENVGFSVAGNPALSITGNLYAGSFVPGAFVGIGV